MRLCWPVVSFQCRYLMTIVFSSLFFHFGHYTCTCIVRYSLIYGFWLSLNVFFKLFFLYLQHWYPVSFNLAGLNPFVEDILVIASYGLMPVIVTSVHEITVTITSTVTSHTYSPVIVTSVHDITATITSTATSHTYSPVIVTSVHDITVTITSTATSHTYSPVIVTSVHDITVTITSTATSHTYSPFQRPWTVKLSTLIVHAGEVIQLGHRQGFQPPETLFWIDIFHATAPLISKDDYVNKINSDKYHTVETIPRSN